MHVLPFPLAFCQHYLPRAERNIHDYVYPCIDGKSGNTPLYRTHKAMPATSVSKHWSQVNKIEGLDRTSLIRRGFWDVGA